MIIVVVVVCIAVGVFFLTNSKKENPEKTPNSDDNAVVDTTAGDETDKTVEVEKQPTEPRYGILTQIAYDYCHDRFVDNYKNGVGEITYYVEKYYGTYDGKIPVIIKGVELLYNDVSLKETVAGYTFTYPDNCAMVVWKNGTFYSLGEAYDSGILTKEQIKQINEVTPIVYDSIEHRYSTSKGKTSDESLEELYKKAKKALTVLDEDKVKEIASAKGFELNMLDYEGLDEGLNASWKDRCYGVFGDCIVLYMEGQTASHTIISVANSVFFHNCGFSIWVYCDNEAYTIKEAYENGLISAEDVETAAENHAIIDDYMWRITHE